jgi:hypothetical protein
MTLRVTITIAAGVAMLIVLGMLLSGCDAMCSPGYETGIVCPVK